MNYNRNLSIKSAYCFYKNSKISNYFVLTISLVSCFIFKNCNKAHDAVNLKFEDELTNYLKIQIDKSIKVDNDKVESLQLLKIDSLSELDIANYAANYNIEKLKSLSKKQNQIGQSIEKATNEDYIYEIKKELNEIKDSLKLNVRISDKIYSSKPDSIKVEYYEYKFLLKTSKSLKKDTVYFYSAKTKKKQVIPSDELINHIIKKYKVK